MYKSKRQQLELIRAQLEAERATFLSHWRELGEYILPRRPRFTISDVNKGDKRNQKIIDSTASIAARTLRSGMMSGVTSPARPWFKLATPDPDLNENGPVKEWLHQTAQIMTTSFLRSNLYNTLPTVYGDLGVFGTAAMMIEEDMNNVMRFYSFPIGSYMIAKDYTGKVNTFVREFRMTIRQVVEQFGVKKNGKWDWSNFSLAVRNLYDAGQYEAWVDVCHMIIPNPEYDPDALESKYNMKFQSVYFERGATTTQGLDSWQMGGVDQNVYLRESGYKYFPVLCPRWEVNGEDVYGTDCPGMTALPDIKQLQVGERRTAQAIEKIINPPLMGPSSLATQKVSILPGDITYLDVRDGMAGLRPVHQVDFRINEMEAKQAQVRDRIQRAFYEDLFLMLSTLDRRQITAREIEERHEEKLLALGPVLEQLNQDLLDPLIDHAFDIHMRQGMIPEPPEELQGMDLKVEYISIMAQAQKLVGLSGIERFAGFAGQMAAIDPSVLDKLNGDQLIDVYADITSVPPSIVRTDEEVEGMRASRARAQQQQQQMQMLQPAARAAKDLSQTDVESTSALTQLARAAQAGDLSGL